MPKPKLFNISLHRNATQSVHNFLKMQGYNSWHSGTTIIKNEIMFDINNKIKNDKIFDNEFLFETYKPVMDIFEAFHDIPIPVLYEKIDQNFPDSYFILVHRNPKDWVKSVRKHIGLDALNIIEKIQYWKYLPDHPELMSNISDIELVSMYEKHLSDVNSYFKNNPRLGIFELGAENIGEKISGFLNLPLLSLKQVDDGAKFRAPAKSTADTAMSGKNPVQLKKAATKLPVIVIFGVEGITLQSDHLEYLSETGALDCRCYLSDENLETILINDRPNAIVSIGKIESFKNLNRSEFETRRRWLHYSPDADLNTVGKQAFQCYLDSILRERHEMPLVSIITPTYKTGARFLRPLNSLKFQTYPNWEWIILDDSDDDGNTAAMIEKHAAKDHRIRLIRPSAPSGIIGDVKYRASVETRGKLIVELDHDDELTPNALQLIVNAYEQNPDCGFFYSDFAELDSKGNSLTYPNGWAFGFGKYRTETYRGKSISVAVAPEINPQTIRHLVSAPNHVRVWRRDVYFQIGGHNRSLAIADDFELMIRTFLSTQMHHIPQLCYLQYHDGQNTQRLRNSDIQRHVRHIAWHYNTQINSRFIELGIDDYMYKKA